MENNALTSKLRRYRSLAPLSALALCLGVAPAADAAFTIDTNFTGNTLTDVGFNLAPPDTHGSVGLAHYVEFTNGNFSIFDKATGAVVGSKISDTAFWNNAGISTVLTNSGLSDTRIIFDHSSQRWFAVEITTSSTGNSMLVARSNTADPTAGFKATSFVADSGFADYPTFGVNADSLVIGTNNFTSSTGSFKNVSLFNILKSDLLQATPTLTNMTTLGGINANTVGFTLQAATDFGASTGYATVLATRGSGSSIVSATRINNNGVAGATLSATTGIGVTTYSDPPNAPQPGSATLLDTGDTRISGGTFKVGDVIYEVHGTSANGHAALAWDKFSDSSRTLLQQGLITDSLNDYYYGSVSANANGDVVIGYTRSSSTSFASSYASVGSTTGGLLSFGGSTLLKQGSSAFELFGSPERWGDYSSTSLDPSDSSSFWTAQEFATTDVNGKKIWATQVTQIKIGAVAVPEAGSLALMSFVALGITGVVIRRRARVA